MGKVGDILGSICFIFIALVFMIGAIRLRIGTITEPQPGFFPFLGGIVLMILSGILLLQGWRGQSRGTEALGEIWGPMILVLGLVFYATAFEIAGYVIVTTIISAIVLRVLETKSLWVLTVTSLILGFGSYFLFDRLLGVPLPVGILPKLW